MPALIDVILSVITLFIGAILIIPEVLFIPVTKNIRKISFYPKAKEALKQLEQEFQKINTGIGTVLRNKDNEYFNELKELISRVYEVDKSSFDEIRFEIHAYKPEIDSVTGNIISLDNRYYLLFIKLNEPVKTEIIDARLLELKLELDFMVRKRFAIAFVIIAFVIIIVELFE